MRLKNNLLVLFIIFCATNAYGQSCDITVTNVSFGSYDPLVSSPLDTSGDINFSCDSGTPFTVILNPGQNSRGIFQPRFMTAPGTNRKLRYNLYLDATRNRVWGDGTGSTHKKAGLGTGQIQKFTVYGRIPARQNVSAGSYSDMVTVTVVW